MPASPSLPPLFVALLAAGRSSRFRAAESKVLHLLGGRAAIGWTAEAAVGAGAVRLLAVVPPGESGARRALAASDAGLLAEPVVQAEPRGTGNAAACAVAACGQAPDETELLIAVADAPLLRAETLEALRHARLEAGASFAWLGFSASDPSGYGRMRAHANGHLERIVEESDLEPHERAQETAQKTAEKTAEKTAVATAVVWSGVVCATLKAWRAHLPSLAAADTGADTGDIRLPDLIPLTAATGGISVAHLCDEREARAFNTRAQAATAEAEIQARLRARALSAGAGLVAPEHVFLSHDTDLAQDCRVEPWVWFGPGVRVATGALIRSFSHLEGVVVGARATVGPFARLRPDTILEEGVRVGNFVEVKASHLGRDTKANHLAYLGDTTTGAETNIGAGAITCNFDGIAKHATTLGARVFVGSNAALVAPLTLGDEVVVGAGTVVTKDAPAGALVVSRTPQENHEQAGARRIARARRAKPSRADKP